MLTFWETNVPKEKLSNAKQKKQTKKKQKKNKKKWDVDFDSIVISILIETETNFKYSIGYLDKHIRPLVLILPKMSGYVKTFKVKDRNNELTSFRINDEKLLEKYKDI